MAKVACSSWTEFFELIDPVVKKRPMVLYFEEIQWLSNYGSELLAEMKPFWDDSWRHQNGLTVVLCGSAPSFIAGEIMADKALYSRSLCEIHLKELNLVEMSEFLGAGPREVILAQLTVGGIPEGVQIAPHAAGRRLYDERGNRNQGSAGRVPGVGPSQPAVLRRLRAQIPLVRPVVQNPPGRYWVRRPLANLA